MREQQIGEYIAEKRKALGLTQEELGKKLGFTGKAVSKWERGQCFPDVDTIHALAGVLLCKAEFLIHGRDDVSYSSDRKTAVPTNSVARVVDGQGACDGQITVSPLLFGGNIEHTRSAVSGGLSAQMLRNRKFVGMPCADGSPLEWFIVGEKCYSMVGNAKGGEPADSRAAHVGSYTRHSDLGYHMPRRYECNSWQLQNFGESAGFGQDALFLEKGKEYECRIVLHTDSAVNLSVQLTSRGGKTIYAQQAVVADSTDWQTIKVYLAPDQSDADADLRVAFCEKTRLVIGAVSLMPTDHFHGMRRDIVNELKNMNVKFLRWPGGNFAGEYNWLDGLLDVDMRAPSESHIAYLTQPHTLGYDFGELNTDDFVALCREVGAEPSLTLNLTWNTPEENAAWVEYCNGDSTTKFGKMRIDRGFAEPYNVKYWSLGNEAGYGHMEGDNTPEGYFVIAKNNAEELLKKDGSLILCSSGFHPEEKWAVGANNKLASVAAWTALHNYTAYPDYRIPENLKNEYENALLGVEENRSKIKQLREYLADDVAIAFDEWNCWYNWYRPADVFTGVFCAKMFHMFIQEQAPCNISASAVFQPISEGCIEVTKDAAALTPMGEAFRTIACHSGGKLLYSSDAVTVTKNGDRITVTLINDSFDTEKTFAVDTEKPLQNGYLLVGDGVGPFTTFQKQAVCVCGDTVTLPPLTIGLLTF